jgi:hypothetical protein
MVGNEGADAEGQPDIICQRTADEPPAGWDRGAGRNALPHLTFFCRESLQSTWQFFPGLMQISDRKDNCIHGMYFALMETTIIT